MAGREVNFDIVARDKASDTLDDVAKGAAKIEKLDPTVTVDADISDAKHTLAGFDDQLDKLTDADKIVVLALRAGAAKAELNDLSTELATIDRADPDVDVKFTRFAEVSGQIDELEEKMKSISETSMDPDVGDKARAKLAGIGEEAGKTQGAVHSMAGNALGDFAATTTGIGPLGEAIGQLTEQAAAGEAGLKGLATAGLGLGAVAGVMVIVQLAMKSFADAAAKAAKVRAFRDDEVKAFADALKHGADVTADLVDRLTEVGKVTELVRGTIGKWDLSKLEDLAPILAQAGIKVEEFAEGVTTGEDGLAKFITAVKATNLSVEQQQLLISGATTEFENLATAEENHKQFAAVFGDQAKQIDLLKASTAQARAEMYGAEKATDGFGGSLGDAERAAKKLTDQYDKLSDQIANDQAFIDLADQIDAVRVAGDEAIAAQHAADEARKKGADDATAKQREAEGAMRDYQTAVNQTKDDIIKIAETAKVNPVELKATLDKVDAGDLAGAKADAEAWSKRNPVQLQAELDLTKILKSIPIIGGILKIQPSPGMATTSTVNQFLAAPDARRQAAAMARTARVNGR